MYIIMYDAYIGTPNIYMCGGWKLKSQIIMQTRTEQLATAAIVVSLQKKCMYARPVYIYIYSRIHREKNRSRKTQSTKELFLSTLYIHNNN